MSVLSVRKKYVVVCPPPPVLYDFVYHGWQRQEFFEESDVMNIRIRVRVFNIHFKHVLGSCFETRKTVNKKQFSQ